MPLEAEVPGANDEAMRRIGLRILSSLGEYRHELSGNGLWIEIYERV
jgi:hypothetical protein